MLRGDVAGDGLEECDGSISPIRFLFGSCVLGLGWAGLGWAGLVNYEAEMERR